jgi:hypothetical protein
MGYGARHSIGVARLVEAKTTGLAPVREIDECKSAFRHSLPRKDSDAVD